MNEIKDIVNHYGMHLTNDEIWYLHQGRNATNFLALSRPSPFEVKASLACPHLINTASPVPDRVHWDTFRRYLSDPLVQKMLPTPKTEIEDIVYIDDAMGELTPYLVALTRLSSPIYPMIFPISQYTKQQVLNYLNISNIGPIVVTGITSINANDMHELVHEALLARRRLILIGEPYIVLHNRKLKRIETRLWDVDQIAFTSLPLEGIGVYILRRFARGENINEELQERKAR